MDIGYRIGNKNDLWVILKFLKCRNSFSGYIGYEDSLKVRKVISRSYKANKAIFNNSRQILFIIAENLETKDPLGYAIYINGVEESITGEKQIMLYDYYVYPKKHIKEIMDHFLLRGEQLAEEMGFKYITLQILVSCRNDEEYFLSRGFHVEMNRIVKSVGTYTFNSRRQKKYKVRFAKESDRMFILLLNAQNSSFLIPKGREENESKIKESYFNTYSTLNFISNSAIKVFIAEDVEEFCPAGYIMIKLSVIDAVSEKILAYIYDINIHKDYWGKYVTQRLVKEAENWLFQRDIDYLIGDTAESNPRPLKTAIRTLGFNLYSRRWVKKL